MKNFIDFLIEECRKKVERETGEICGDVEARKELNKVFKSAKINKSSKYKILRLYKSNPLYRISRAYAIRLGVAFGFEIEEMDIFLASAGYSLSECFQQDMSIRKLLMSKKCTVDDIIPALYNFRE